MSTAKMKCSKEDCDSTLASYPELISHLISAHDFEEEIEIRSFEDKAGILSFEGTKLRSLVNWGFCFLLVWGWKKFFKSSCKLNCLIRVISHKNQSLKNGRRNWNLRKMLFFVLCGRKQSVV